MRIRYAIALLAVAAQAQTALTWQQVKERFLANNPSLRAGEIGIQESRASEITANLRPNPDFTISTDQIQPFPGTGVPWRPFTYAFPSVAVGYLHEREHKRELRLESAQQATGIAEAQQLDLIRNMNFTLRQAFVATLQAKALLVLAKADLDYFDRELGINRERYRAGDIARVDLSRLVLQRAQFESDYEAAQVGLRTAKITILMLLNDRTPVDRFDIAGNFDFTALPLPLEAIHQRALAARPDLHAAEEAVAKAQTDHRLAIANGSTDPSFGMDLARNPPIPVYIGFNVNIPLRIFDRNQGEKARTALDIGHAEKARDAAKAQVFNDVDSAYYTVESALDLLKPYRQTYLETATDVRDTISYAYQHGQAALVDYLDAQRDYRATQTAYITLVGSYLTAAAQLNLAAGDDVVP